MWSSLMISFQKKRLFTSLLLTRKGKSLVTKDYFVKEDLYQKYIILHTLLQSAQSRYKTNIFYYLNLTCIK